MDVLVADTDMTDNRSKRIGTIFSKNRAKLVGFIQKRIQNIDVSEDMAQDVFYKFSNLEETIVSAEAWIYTVARNQIKDYFKKRKEAPLEPYLSDEDKELPALIADISNMPDALYAREMIWEELEDALAMLPDEQRDAFALHELENYSIKEIAELQRTSVGTVLSRKRYAVAFLRDRLNEFYQELNI